MRLQHKEGQDAAAQASWRGRAMPNDTDLLDLARKIAEIASTTTDPETGRQLMELVERLLREAGLPPDGRNERPD
jgi:hypothetical protein